MGILRNKKEMAILKLIRFGPHALINNLIKFRVSYKARNFVISSASLLF